MITINQMAHSPMDMKLRVFAKDMDIWVTVCRLRLNVSSRVNPLEQPIHWPIANTHHAYLQHDYSYRGPLQS